MWVGSSGTGSRVDEIWPQWDDATLAVKSDSAWRARYRKLQSWYREQVVRVPPGTDSRGIVRGNLLPADAVAENPGLNFLDDRIAAYVEQRVPEIAAAAGTIDSDRLYRNMLSSMPLCFNLFGALRKYPGEAAAALTIALNLDVELVCDIVVEWAPERSAHLDDRTAFDAFITYRDSAGQHAFLGVETKYTEPFSRTEYDTPRLREITADPRVGFNHNAADRLVKRATNQLWRNSLLVHSLRSSGEYADGHVIVMACDGDTSAKIALSGLAADLKVPNSLVRQVSYERLIEILQSEDATATWAMAFRRRYLDLSPVGG